MVATSPWLITSQAEINRLNQIHFDTSINDFKIELINTELSIFIIVSWPTGGRIAFRAAYCPNSELNVRSANWLSTNSLSENEGQDKIELLADCAIGNYRVTLEFPDPGRTLLHYTTSLTPVEDILFPFWPRDILPLGIDGDPLTTSGEVYTQQIGPRSGLIFLSLTESRSGSLIYFQNLTALNNYCQKTETSLSGVVGGQWPELGFALPATDSKPLPAGEEVVLSDTFICFSPEIPADDLPQARLYLDLLAEIYLHIPRIPTVYQDWPKIVVKSLHNLENCPDCWSKNDDHRYVNAYMADYDTPPESMVQLSVLIPLVEYSEWSGKDISIVHDLKKGLNGFYDKKIGSIVRWLPAAEGNLKGDEP